MAAEIKVTINVSSQGLGRGSECKDSFVDSTTPEVVVNVESMVQEVADTAQALDVGSIDTVKGLWITAIENDLLIDTSYSASFSAEVRVREGQSRYIEPYGTVYIKNETALEKCTFGYLVWGLQD
jgi:hypothetical protein